MKSCLNILLAALLFATGCGVGHYSASTTATYQISPDGTKLVSYTSNKEQQGLDVELKEEDGKIKLVRIHVDKSGTMESIVAAIAAQQAQIGKLFETLLPLASQAAKMGGS